MIVGEMHIWKPQLLHFPVCRCFTFYFHDCSNYGAFGRLHHANYEYYEKIHSIQLLVAANGLYRPLYSTFCLQTNY